MGASCSDYIIDVRPFHSHQTEGQEFVGQITGEELDRFKIEEVTLGIGGDTINLDLEFNVRQQSSRFSSVFTVVGQGNNISFDFVRWISLSWHKYTF